MPIRPPKSNPDCVIVHLVVERQFYHGPYAESGQGSRESRKA